MTSNQYIVTLAGIPFGFLPQQRVFIPQQRVFIPQQQPQQQPQQKLLVPIPNRFIQYASPYKLLPQKQIIGKQQGCARCYNLYGIIDTSHTSSYCTR